MRQAFVSFARSLLVLNLVGHLAYGAESAKVDARCPAVVSVPERWLDFDRGVPMPLAIRADGRCAAVASDCQTLLYDLDATKVLHVWDERFASAGFSRNGRFLWTSGSGEVSVWDAQSYALVRRITGRSILGAGPYASNDYLIGKAISPDGRWIAIANNEQVFHCDLPDAVRVYEVATGDLRQTLATPPRDHASKMEFLLDNRRMLVWYWKPVPRLWNLETGTCLREFPETVAQASPDGRWIATRCGLRLGTGWLGNPAELVIWDAATGDRYRVLNGQAEIAAFAFSPDSTKILASLSDTPKESYRLIEWEIDSGRTLFEGDAATKPYCLVAYSADGQRRLAATGEYSGVDDDVDYHLRVWIAKTDTSLPTGDYLFDYSACAYGLVDFPNEDSFVFFPKGDRFLKLSEGFAVRDVLTGEAVQTLPMYRSDVTEVAFMPDGENVLVGVGTRRSGRSHLVNLVSGKMREWNLECSPRGAVFVDHGRLLFTCGPKGIHLIDVLSSRIVWSLPIFADEVAISADGQHIVASQRQERPWDERPALRLVLIETSDPDNPQVFPGDVSAVAMRPDGQRFLAATPNAIEECEVPTGTRVRAFSDTPGRARCVAYSPDGEWVLAGGVAGHRDPRERIEPKDEGWAMLWSTKTGEAIPLKGHAGAVTTATFSPDGRHCATGSLDRTIWLWETSDGQPVGLLRRHVGGIHRIAYSPRGDRILSTAEDGAAVWNLAPFAPKPIATVPLPASFTKVESVDVWKATVQGIERPTGAFLPIPPGYEPTSLWQQQPWPVLETKLARRDRLTWHLTAWLSGATGTKHIDLPSLSRGLPYQLGETFCDASPDGRRTVYERFKEDQLVLRDDTGAILQTWNTTGDFVHALLSPSGRELVVGAMEIRRAADVRYQMTVYDTRTGVEKRVFRDGDLKGTEVIAIDPREESMMIRENDGVRVHNYQTGATIGLLSGGLGGRHPEPVFSPDGRFIATAPDSGRTVNLYDRTTLRLCKTLSSSFPVASLAFSPDGKRLLVRQTAGEELYSLMTLWEIDSDRKLWSRCAYCGGGRVVFSPDGTRTLVRESEGCDQISSLWDAKEGRILCVILGLQKVGEAMPVFGDDGASLRLGTPSGPVLWP